MRSIDLLAILIKVASIILFVSLLKSTSEMIGFYRSGYLDDSELGNLVIFPFIYNALGYVLFLVLWNFPISVAQFIHPKFDSHSELKIGIEKDALEAIVYSGIGIYLLSTYLPNLAFDIAYFLIINDTQNLGFAIRRDTAESLLQIMFSLLVIGMGFLLCFFSGRVGSVLRSITKRL